MPAAERSAGVRRSVSPKLTFVRIRSRQANSRLGGIVGGVSDADLASPNNSRAPLTYRGQRPSYMWLPVHRPEGRLSIFTVRVRSAAGH